MPPRISISALRDQIIGRDLAFRTPFGYRHLFYADYTASGRALESIERSVLRMEESYANTHTEDDYSGKRMTRLLHAAERRIKDYVHAGEQGKIFPIGSGSTGALKKLQEILGVYVPPAAQARYAEIGREARKAGFDWPAVLEAKRPVVFIGPYEHHTNELMWREALAEVVVIDLDAAGRLDLGDLEKKLADPRFRKRTRYASFSAGSNITGIRTPVYEVARLCRRGGVPVFFDFAAVAPYVEIDMNRDPESAFDAVFFSPHKFLGGPGSCGILVMNGALYRSDLPPTTAGGGTVVYVGRRFHDFAEDVETRESAGTPPILQTIRAALVLDIKEMIGVPRIERIESGHLARFLAKIRSMKSIRLIGRYQEGETTPIVSFNVVHGDRILHPKFVTKLLNDLFGIQSRAGCSCAGPYGHILLDIDEDTSGHYRGAILCGRQGLKPGWVRINLHYIFTRRDIDFLLAAVDFVARRGPEFLRRYAFDIKTGEWNFLGYEDETPSWPPGAAAEGRRVNLAEIESERARYLRRAEAEAGRLAREGTPGFAVDSEETESLKYFYYVHARPPGPRRDDGLLL
jgi:selenocysteine lyase/cysteine desulfurase